jgi:hypothetical protein
MPRKSNKKRSKDSAAVKFRLKANQRRVVGAQLCRDYENFGNLSYLDFRVLYFLVQDGANTQIPAGVFTLKADRRKGPRVSTSLMVL